MKKTLFILLTLIIGINLDTQAYDFLSVYNGDTIYYNITSSLPRTVEVTYNKNNLIPDYSGDLIIPDSVFFLDNYYKVTSISYCNFASCTDLTSIGIPNSVTSIGGSAFYGCTSLTSITIPNSVTSIGFCAFASCTGLTSITIPSSVTSISEGAFQDCTGLTSIIIPNSVTSIGGSAFYNCSGLTSITIPTSVISIGGVAFSGTPYYDNKPDGVVYINNVLYNYKGTMPANTSINILDGIISISQYAFYNCTGLTSITIPNSVTSIGSYAFGGCDSLTSITIPNSVTSIGSCAFICTPYYENKPDGVVYINNVLYNYKGTMPANTSISIRSGTINISPEAFQNCSGLTSIIIPNSVTSIGGSAFCSCGHLTLITIPNSVTSIAGNVFAGCSSLTSITIPNSITSIGGYAFYNCTSLTSITIPTSVTSISYYAFGNCGGLTSITIPNSVTSIGDGAFSYCTGLTSITCNSIIPPAVSSNSFDSVNKSIPLYVPCSSINLYQQTPDWRDFTNYRCTSDLDDELKLSTSTKLYPNPTNNKSKLEVEGLKSEADVIVYDLFGRVIKSYKINPTNNELEIDVSSFDKGIYSVSVQNNNINVSKKLIVQ